MGIRLFGTPVQTGLQSSEYKTNTGEQGVATKYTTKEKRQLLKTAFNEKKLRPLYTPELERLFQEFLVSSISDLRARTEFNGHFVTIRDSKAGVLSASAETTRILIDQKKSGEQEKQQSLQDFLEQEEETEVPEVEADLDSETIRHPRLDAILNNIRVGNFVFLVGPAGSGKTTIAQQIASMLGLDFYFTGAVHQKHDMMGYTDINSDVVRTPFREAYENGGLFLFDEYDASVPNAITSFNAALSNGMCAFPDKIVPQHKDFVAIAAGNTYGTGASRQYVGRFQQDAASLDRFVFIEIDYDTELETKLAAMNFMKAGGKKENSKKLMNLLETIRGIRAKIKELGIPHIVSPRASIMGARLLALDLLEEQEIHEQVIYKGLSEANRQQINGH